MERINAFIAFGGNLGDVRESFNHARNALDETNGINLIASSKIYRTPPVGPARQPDYLNAVVGIETTLEPLELLDQLHEIEEHHGRVRYPEPPRWSARTLDLDILTYEKLLLDLDRLTIPHPMLQHRMFVLCPLCDINPNWQHPLLKVSAKKLMNALITKGEPPLPQGEAW